MPKSACRWSHLIACAALVLPNAAAVAQQTTWVHEGAAPGDWFTPANWSNGVPAAGPPGPPNVIDFSYSALIDNDGAARIAAGLAETAQLAIGQANSGELIIDGGQLNVAYSVTLGEYQHSVGRLALNGGALNSFAMFVGRQQGTGRIDQVGGTLQANVFALGSSHFFWPTPEPNPITPDDLGHGEYNLLGGQAQLHDAMIGNSGVGHFRQSGGAVTVAHRLTIGGQVAEQQNPWVPYYELGHGVVDESFSSSQTADVRAAGYLMPPAPSRGRYELSGGSLTTFDLFIDNTGEVRQTGGKLTADYLELTAAGRYELEAGTLRIESGLQTNDGFDFAHSSATLSAGSAIVNFSHPPQNAENAKIDVGPNSLTILPAQFDVATQIGQFSTQGLVHRTGDDLSVPANRTVEGRGTINDHAIVGGELLVSSQELGAINLNGLELKAGGEVDLGLGSLRVSDDRTVIRNGSFKGEQIDVAGTVIYVPVHLTTTGEPLPPIIPLYPDITPGLARQTAGSVDVDQLSISNGRYEISGGTLTARRIDLGAGYNSFPTASTDTVGYGMTQHGGTVSVGTLDLNPLYIYPMFRQALTSISPTSLPPIPSGIAGKALYEIHGGTLQADRIALNSGYFSQGAEFIQTGGSVTVAQELRLFGQESRYAISGGSLQVRRLQIGATGPGLDHIGTLAILNADARVDIAGELLLGAGSQVVAVPGSAIRFTRPATVDSFEYPPITGNSLSIRSTDPEAMAGLANLTLTFEGGADLPSTIEAAGADLGPSLAGFYKNFAIDTLVIGGVEPARLSLVDLVENHAGGTLPNALYVDHLVVNEGSTLDLNGLQLYYRTASIAASSLTADGTFGVQVIPEPAAAVLALLAAPLSIRRRAS